MKNRIVKIMLAICIGSVMLVGCGGSYDMGSTVLVNQAKEEPDRQESMPERDDIAEGAEVDYTPVELEGAYERATYLADKVYEAKGSANTMVSPLSLDMALGLVSGGAKGQTKEELLTYLGTEDYGQFAAQYMEYAKGLNTDSETKASAGYNRVYELANSIWVKNDRNLVDEYVTKARQQYDAEIEAVSFEQSDLAGTVEQINDWCNEKTHELIPEIITEDAVSEDTVAILLNSLYFECPWRESWGMTTDNFTDFEGNVTQQEMLRDMLTTYYENESATAFGKEYQNGMQFIGILPKETGEFTLSDLDVESLLESKTTEYDVDALMPKLNFDTTADCIVDILEAQGVKTIFDREKSDLTGLIQMEADEVTYVSDIIQKTKIELDENGTKAAAVTAVVANLQATAVQEFQITKQVRLDRPFAFVIYDEMNEQIVFVGKVVAVEE